MLDIVALSETYQRMQMIHSYVKPAKPRVSQASKPKKPVPVAEADIKSISSISIVGIITDAKNRNRSVVDALREHFTVEEVAV